MAQTRILKFDMVVTVDIARTASGTTTWRATSKDLSISADGDTPDQAVIRLKEAVLRPTPAVEVSKPEASEAKKEDTKDEPKLAKPSLQKRATKKSTGKRDDSEVDFD